jgi:hypothetical protein
MGLHKSKSVPIRNKWDIAHYTCLPAASTVVEIDFSKLSTTTYNKLLKLIEVYPANPGKGYGYSSQCRKLFNALSRHMKLPQQNMNDWGMSFTGIDNKQLWEELYEICLSDAIAKRLQGDEWNLNRLNRDKEKMFLEGDIIYWHGSPEFYATLPESDLFQRVANYIRNRSTEALEKMYDIAAYGGCIRFELTK